MKLSSLLAPIALGLLVSLAQGNRELQGRFDVTVERVDGDLLCSIRARQAPLELLITELASQAGMQLNGLATIVKPGTVTARLQQRPYEQAVHFVLGSVGLRGRILADTLFVSAETSAFPTADELDDLAEVAYLRALKDHPAHPLGAQADMALAEIQEARGNLSAARSRYEFLVESHPDSKLVPDALLKAGRVLERMQEWADAAEKFSALANVEEPHPHRAEARLELARCTTRLGKHREALYMLDALDSFYPAASAAEELERLMIRARALNGTGDYIGALRALEHVAELGPDIRTQKETMMLRGQALELSGRLSQAATAWMIYARGISGEEQADALAEAARLSIAANDELGALFIAGHAARQGHADRLRPLANVARTRLGLESADLGGGTLTEKLERAKHLLARGFADQARLTLQAVYHQRAFLDEPLLFDVVLTYVTSLEQALGLDEAISLLREALGGIEDDKLRKRLYIFAAELLERHGRYNEAVEAYAGVL